MVRWAAFGSVGPLFDMFRVQLRHVVAAGIRGGVKVLLWSGLQEAGKRMEGIVWQATWNLKRGPE